MKNLYFILFIFSFSSNALFALSFDDCSRKYEKAKQFTQNTRLFYIYLKSTKTCLIKFKNQLIKNPDSSFKVESMNENILMINDYINELIPRYQFLKNTLESIPKYLYLNSENPILNSEYKYFKRFKNCNGIHAYNKIYIAAHCNIVKSINIQYDLSYIKSNTISELKVGKLNLDKIGTFKYYSMSKEGMFYNVLLQERNCKFYKVKNIPSGLNETLDVSDLRKEYEIRSTCLAIASNSGGGVFQDGVLVGIISKTVFNKDEFLYSILEPIFPLY